ncbi:hypothetical protein P4631_09160 [Halalkalibacterium halodurans]|uniref:hypothetical protein n=1 Tax=Halalkalibacterium halodurans TaxID=86665 RepID=UPI002E1B39FA|nr:hypothetical protein [Halalkalibacterium halodurans]
MKKFHIEDYESCKRIIEVEATSKEEAKLAWIDRGEGKVIYEKAVEQVSVIGED